MANKGGSNRTKRQMAPAFWAIPRKSSQFVVTIKPGPYPKDRAYPLGILLRDILKVSNTMQESKLILNGHKIKVDGVIRRKENFGVGLMDVVELVDSKEYYRLVPKNSRLLAPIPIDESEKNVKLVKVKSKHLIKGKKLQYGFHDGKTLIDEGNYSVGDSCLIELPEVKVLKHIKFSEGNKAIIIDGDNAGRIGNIDEIKTGTFSLPKRVLFTSDEDQKTVELPFDIVMSIGEEKSEIKVK
jgi:small subunit ribosomal protein S4e